MRLEMGKFPVERMGFDGRTRYEKGALTVSREELSSLVLQDPRISEVSFDVARPGEKVRITDVRDVVDARVKVQGPGCTYPGVLGPPATVGSGVTNWLTGCSVVPSAEVPTSTAVGTQTPRASFIDMWGPGALTGVSQTVNLVVLLKLAPNLTDLDYHYAVQLAELKVARRLAEATVGQKPPEVELFDLSEVDPKLPKVVFIQGALTTAHQPHPGITFYGMPIRESMPIYVHPNELLDGAVLVESISSSAISPSSWQFLNHPIVLDMYRAHGKRFNFKGVVIERIRFETMDGKIRTAEQTAKLLQLMGVQGMVITWMKAGNAFIDVQMTVEACEKAGIRTVVVTYEWGGESGQDPPVLFVVPEAQGMVSTGNSHRFKSQGSITFPAPDRVIGATRSILIDHAPGAPVVPGSEELTFTRLYGGPIYGGVDLWGEGTRTCREF